MLQFAPVIVAAVLIDATVAVSTSAALRVTHGTTMTTVAARPAIVSATRRMFGARAAAAAPPRTNTAGTNASARARSIAPKSAPVRTKRHHAGRSIAVTAVNTAAYNSGIDTVSLMSAPSTAISDGYTAASAAATRPTCGPAIRRPMSPVRTTVTVPATAPAYLNQSNVAFGKRPTTARKAG